METLTIQDLDYLAIGTAILGSGGGGNPENEILMAQHAMQQDGPIRLLDPSKLTAEDLILPVAAMGAPLVGFEKLRSGGEFRALMQLVEKTQGRKPTALMPLEIGGANAFAAFTIAGQMGLPVLNGDLMGRAFPQLQMTSLTVKGINPSPVFMADSLGNTAIVESSNAAILENIARHITVSMGSSCCIAFRPINKEEAKQAVVPNTMTQAIELGKVIVQARENGTDPTKALISASKGIRIGGGTITSIEQSIRQGFLEGNVHILGEEGNFELLYQNEYLLAKKEGLAMACTPDILMLLEKESGTPITSESLRYGLQVCLIALPAPQIWQSKRGLELAGPQCFGYPIHYQTIRGKK